MGQTASTTSQSSRSNGNSSDTKDLQAVPARQKASSAKPKNGSPFPVSDKPKESNLLPGAATNTLMLRDNESDVLARPLPPDAPGLYPGKLIIRLPRFIEPLSSRYKPEHSNFLEEHESSIHMFTLPVGGEAETAVCLYSKAAAYLKQHRGFSLPLSISKGAEASWELKEVAGLGKAVLAKRDISPGDVIIAERPLIVFCTLPNDPAHPTVQGEGWEFVDTNANPNISSAHKTTTDTYRLYPKTVNRLGPERRKVFFGMLDSKSEICTRGNITKAEGIVRSNSLQLPLPGMPEGVESGVVCENISRANHSCMPNAHYYFNYVNFSYELRALNLIRANTEITVTYTDPYVPRAVRQSILSRDFAFTCSCIGCTDSSADQRLIDVGLVMLKEFELQNQLADKIIERGPPEASDPTLVALRRLYADNAYLFSSDPVPDHAGHVRMQLIVKWALLEMVFGSLVWATEIAMEGRKVLEKMEPCPSSKNYRKLDALIKGGKGSAKSILQIREWT